MVDDAGLLAHLAYLTTAAEQPGRPHASIELEVTGRGPYECYEQGTALATVGTPEDVVYVLYRRCYARLIEHQASAGWASIHAALVSIAGRRALVVGDKEAGKTTLMLRLLHDGQAVEGDEAVFTRGGEAICMPRNFQVKAGTRPLIPELAPLWADLPRVSTDDGAVISAFDPAAAGFPWKLRRGPVSLAFVLRSSDGTAAACRRIASGEMVAVAIANCRPNGIAPADVVRACSALLGDVTAYELRVGDLTRTAQLLVAALGDCPDP